MKLENYEIMKFTFIANISRKFLTILREMLPFNFISFISILQGLPLNTS